MEMLLVPLPALSDLFDLNVGKVLDISITTVDIHFISLCIIFYSSLV